MTVSRKDQKPTESESHRILITSYPSLDSSLDLSIIIEY